jgi:hypothetical protein
MSRLTAAGRTTVDVRSLLTSIRQHPRDTHEDAILGDVRS